LEVVPDSSSDNYLVYSISSEVGMSGSPVILGRDARAIGIHTNGCSGNNLAAGTSFKNQALLEAIEAFEGPDTVFVDSGHPELAEDGSIFRPFDTLEEGLSALPPGGILSVVSGIYTLQSGTIINGSLSAPVGPVTIQ
jgi:hypothetical protein